METKTEPKRMADWQGDFSAVQAALLLRLATAYIYSGAADYERSRKPAPGDFVYVQGTLLDIASPGLVLGFLREVLAPATKDDFATYVVDTVAGRQIRWGNVQCLAIPIGNIHNITSPTGLEATERWQANGRESLFREEARLERYSPSA